MLILRKSQVRAYDRRNPTTGQSVHVKEHSDSRTRHVQPGLFGDKPRAPTQSRAQRELLLGPSLTRRFEYRRKAREAVKEYRKASKGGDRKSAGKIRWEVEKDIRVHDLDREEVFGRHTPEAQPLTSSKHITAAEEGLRYDDIESCVGWGADGEVTLEKTGEKSEIIFDKDEMNQMRGGQGFTHNHPSGGSFSIEDILFAASLNLKEMRAVTTHRKFSMKPGPNGWPRTDDIHKVVKSTDAKVTKEFTQAIAKEGMTPQYADLSHHDRLWQLVAKRLGMVYKKEEVGMDQGELFKGWRREKPRTIDEIYEAFMADLKRGKVTLDQGHDIPIYGPEAKGEVDA